MVQLKSVAKREKRLSCHLMYLLTDLACDSLSLFLCAARINLQPSPVLLTSLKNERKLISIFVQGILI